MITFIVGSNTYARSEAVTKLRQAFLDQHGLNGIEQYAGDQIQVADLAATLTSVSLFASHRLVVITQLSANKLAAERLLELLDTVPDTVHIVLIEPQPDKRTVFYKTLYKTAVVVTCDELDESALVRWIAEYAVQHDGTIDATTARHLVRHVGVDQLRLKHELDKLLAFAPAITKDHIELLVEEQPQDTVFTLLDYALRGKKVAAQTVLSELERAHEDPYQIASMLVWQTQILAIVASSGAPHESQIAKDAKLNPFVVKKTRGLAARLPRTQINHIIDVASQLDVTLKTMSADPWRVLETSLLTL